MGLGKEVNLSYPVALDTNVDILMNMLTVGDISFPPTLSSIIQFSIKDCQVLRL